MSVSESSSLSEPVANRTLFTGFFIPPSESAPLLFWLKFSRFLGLLKSRGKEEGKPALESLGERDLAESLRRTFTGDF